MRPYGWREGRWRGEKKGLEEERPGACKGCLQKTAKRMQKAPGGTKAVGRGRSGQAEGKEDEGGGHRGLVYHFTIIEV